MDNVAELDVADSKDYEVEAIYNNKVYASELKDYLLWRLYYVILWKD